MALDPLHWPDGRVVQRYPGQGQQAQRARGVAPLPTVSFILSHPRKNHCV